MPRSRYPALWIMFFMIAAFGWLLNFEVVNFHLAGMVDSAEACLMACLALALATRSWKALPLLGAIGGLAKETLVPLAFLFAFGWASGLLHAAVRPFTSWVAASLPDTAHMP